MLYRVHTNGSMEWVNYLNRDDVERAREFGGDLDRIEWDEAERVLDQDTLRVALRTGWSSRVGLIVDVGELVPLDRLGRLLESYHQMLDHRPEYRKTLERLEAVWPGVLDEEDAANAELDAALLKSHAEAAAERDAALAVEPNPDLVEHWKSLGGLLPDPQ